MKTLKEAIQDYLALRRSLGFKLKKHSRFLEEFALFLEQAGELRITSRLALQWATQPQQIQQSEWAARLSVVRGFARYWSATDPMTEIPPEGLLPYRPRRAKPYLYSDEQIQQLLEAAKNMPTTHSLQPWTYHCLFGLLAVTGLRISEALNLRSTDVDWSEGILTIRDSKFGKSRLIPLHASSLNVLSDYGARRDLLFAHRKTPYFFCSRLDGRLDEGQVRRVFYVISRQIGIRDASASRGPRLHDFRHRFAVQTLLHWHRTGEDVRRRFLGNRHREEKLAVCRHLLGMPKVEKNDAEPVPKTDYLDRYEDLTGRSLRQCPQCRRGNMVVVRILARWPAPSPAAVDSS